MDPVGFVTHLSGYIYIALSIFWTVTAVVFHKRLRTPLPVALSLGFVLQAVGFGVMLFLGLAHKADREYSASIDSGVGGPFSGSSNLGGDPFGSYSPRSSDFNFQENNSALDRSKFLPLGLLGGGILLLLVASFLKWFYSSSDNFGELGIGVLSSGLEVWILLTIFVGITSTVFILRRWSAAAPMLLAFMSGWWFALGLAALTSRLAFVLGMASVFQLPDVVSSTIGYDAIVSQRVGEAWLLVFPASILMLAAAFLLASSYAKASDSEKAYLL